jgi:hypothetical protein
MTNLEWNDFLDRTPGFKKDAHLKKQLNEIRDAYMWSHLGMVAHRRFEKFGTMSHAKTDSLLKQIGLSPDDRKQILQALDATVQEHIVNGVKPRKPFTYGIRCPECGHEMEVGNEGGPIHGKQCDKCSADFSFTSDELVAKN